jgi:hypothetical protein
MAHRLVWGPLAVVVVFFGAGVLRLGAEQPTSAKPALYRNTALGVAYVGSKACAQCHQDIYSQFIRTAMGRSMARVSDVGQLDEVSAPVNLFD